MMHPGNLANRPPLGLKGAKPGKDRGHMARVAILPCVCCGARPVEVHHVICGRYSQRKAPDTHTIPLCYLHHRGADGIHTRREWWVQTYAHAIEDRTVTDAVFDTKYEQSRKRKTVRS